ncbi:MAG TPA: LLM class F420-dependent oxidoreductase [Myxococcota bacterium]|nr:LLM class F420-dependent oxidoreductase [Myxococcota bacterium]
MRYGVTIPFDGIPLGQQRAAIEELEARGYTDLWSAESSGTDGFTPLVLASQWAPSLRLGCAIFPVYTRGPALLAMSVASLCQAAPGRVVVGLGSSSNVIVEQWNGIPFEKPYQRTRDTALFLREALRGEKVTHAYETFSVKSFRLGVAVPEQPKILIAALRQGMLGLAGKVGDGAILNWLSAGDVKKVVPHVKKHGAEKEIVARLFVCPNPDSEKVRAMGRMAVSAYLNVPVYRAFHEWLGRQPELHGMWERWGAGDRKGAVAAIPDRVVDDLIIHGSPEACREHIARYVEAGVDTPVLALLPLGMDPLRAARELAPR